MVFVVVERGVLVPFILAGYNNNDSNKLVVIESNASVVACLALEIVLELVFCLVLVLIFGLVLLLIFGLVFVKGGSNKSGVSVAAVAKRIS